MLSENSRIFDPFAPVSLGMNPSSSTPSLQRQLQRRAEILATARRLLAEDGRDHFTLRRVSEICNVTVQTIHNSFGARDELLICALNEHTRMMDAVARQHSNDPTFLLDLASGYCHTAFVAPHFLREMMRTAFSGRKPLLGALQRYGANIKAIVLREMARDQLLKSSVNVDMLATQIARINSCVIYEWAQYDDVDELRRQIISGNSLLLMASLTPAAARAIEDWLDANPQKNWRDIYAGAEPMADPAPAHPTMN